VKEIFQKTQFIGLKSPKGKDSIFFVLPIPYEKTTSYGKGTKNGPKAIIEASGQIETWDEELKQETYKHGIVTLPAINCKKNTERVFKEIERTVSKLPKTSIPFFLGGEHSVSQATVSAVSKKHKNTSILHFDAHADLRPSYEGSKNNHACAMYPFRKTHKIVQIGIRSVAPEEKSFVNSGKVKTFLMHENSDVKKLIPKILKNLTDTVFLSIDVDGFDPSVIPGTGTPQPGGFLWYPALDVFREVCKKKKIVGVDIVEVAPRPNDTTSEFATAKLAYRLMGYISKHR
jgi:agmatinase